MTSRHIHWPFLRPAARSYESCTFVIHLTEQPVAALEAWIDAPDGRVTVIPTSPVALHQTVVAGMLDLDVRDPRGERLLALSLDDDGRLRYARSILLERAGLPAGTFDAPVLAPTTAAIRQPA